MRAELYRIPGPWPGRMAIAPRPRAREWLEEEVRAWSSAGIDLVVSLLTSDEISDLELDQEESACQRAQIEFVSFPVVDRSVPASKKSTSELLTKLSAYLGSGKTIVIHCRQGIGRSALLAASLLITAGKDADSALERISAARGCPVPETPEQKAWIMEFASSVTNLNPKKVASR